MENAVILGYGGSVREDKILDILTVTFPPSGDPVQPKYNHKQGTAGLLSICVYLTKICVFASIITQC